MSEELLIRHCSPTLANIKTGNLINYRFKNINALKQEVSNLNLALNKKGISICILKYSANRALIYVYRPAKLSIDLSEKKVLYFLHKEGYKSENITGLISELSEKMSRNEEFPHEIGVFLGYPFEDVIGFIENKGKNFKYCGCWKVYYNVGNAIKTFEKYKKCTSIFCKQHNKGRSLNNLIVVA